MELFNKKAVRRLIEFKWPLVREYVIKRLFIPFVAYLLLFTIYMGYIYEWRLLNKWYLHTLNWIFMLTLFIFSFYFLGIETYQLKTNKLAYFASIWNYLDLIPPLLLVVFIPLSMAGTFNDEFGIEKNQTLEASLQATMSLMLWLKFLYFLRIFQSTGYLIKIIIAVCVDMRYFLLI